MLKFLLNRKKIINDYCENIGSIEVQILLLTFRINKLQLHFNHYKKDFHSKYGLLKLVFKRKRLLNYLKSNDFKLYNVLLKRLNIRH